jgi:hypothetical protein
MTATHCGHFRYQSLTIRVVCEPADLAWLEEFLAPQFEVVDSDPPHCTVTMVADTASYLAALGAGQDPTGAEVECFAHDTETVRLPLWTALDASRVIFQKDVETLFSASPDKTSFRILTPSGNRVARTALMRVVRELAMTHADRTGALIVHAAALRVGGRGVIIAGPKRAGKTTLLMHLLGRGAGAFVSNDRVVVSVDGPSPRMRGMPTIVRLRSESVERFPRFRERLAASAYHHRFRLAETSSPSSASSARNDYSSLSPAQFCTLLHVSSVAQAPVDVILFPRVTGERGPIRLTALSPGEAAAQLPGALFRAALSPTTFDFFAPPGPAIVDDPGSVERLCRELTSRVRSLTCELGANAYESDDSTSQLLARLAA